MPSDSEFEFEELVCRKVANWYSKDIAIVYTGRDSNDSDAKLIHSGREFGCLEVTKHDNNEIIKTGTILSNLEIPFMYKFPEVLSDSWIMKVEPGTPKYFLEENRMLTNVKLIQIHKESCSRCNLGDLTCPDYLQILRANKIVSLMTIPDGKSLIYVNLESRFSMVDGSGLNFKTYVENTLNTEWLGKKIGNLISRANGGEAHLVIVLGTETPNSLYGAFHEPYRAPRPPVEMIENFPSYLNAIWLVSQYLDLAYSYNQNGDWRLFSNRQHLEVY